MTIRNHTRKVALIVGAALAVTTLATRAATSPSTEGGSPALAGPDLKACNSSTTCLHLNNVGTGFALTANAAQRTSIEGATASTRNKFLKVRFRIPGTHPEFLAFGRDSGIAGIDRSTSPDDTNQGLLGVSQNGGGVVGVTYSKNPNGAFAAQFLDGNTDPSSANVAVLGASYHIGVWGVGPYLYGVRGQSANSIGVIGRSTFAVGTYALSYAPDMPALIISNFGTGPLIHAFNASSEVALLDNAGNMVLAGDLTTNGTPMARVASSRGSDRVAYLTRKASPSIEDEGEAQLVNGRGYVRLDETFARTVDARAAYMVFLTAEGDSRGLYVTQRSAAGFAVRESGGGSSSLAFSYRIVAKPLNARSDRLPEAPVLRVSPREAAMAAREVKQSKLDGLRGF